MSTTSLSWFSTLTVNQRTQAHEADTLAARVKGFIRDSQLDYRRYFLSQRPQLLSGLIQRLQGPETREVIADRLPGRIALMKANEGEARQYGLELNTSELMELEQCIAKIDFRVATPSLRAAIEAYVETMEHRISQRQLIIDRLARFERIMESFALGKHISINAKDGLTVFAPNASGGVTLKETQLSSGEYQLLYIMVTALTSLSRGTVVAIDEPELSLHVSWQRELIRKMSECASGASPHFILATHAPTLFAEYVDAVVELK